MDGKELEFPKASALIAMSNTISLVQRKVLNGLLYYASQQVIQDPGRRTFFISLSELKEATGINKKDYKYIAEQTKELMGRVYECNNLNKDKSSNVKWKATVLLADAEIVGEGDNFDSMTLKYSFSEAVRNNIIPKIYGLINLQSIQRISASKYTGAIYEVCKDYVNVGTGVIPLDVFYRLMGVTNQYAKFSDFKKRILDPAVKEVNLQTEIEIEYVVSRTKKFIQGIQFSITRKTTDHMKKSAELRELIDMLPVGVRNFEKVKKELETWYKKQGFAYVESNIKFAIKNTKDIKNTEAFVSFLAITLKYDNGEIGRKKQQEKVETIKKTKELTTQRKNKIEEESKKAQEEAILYKTYFDGLPQKEQEGIWEQMEKGTYLGPKDQKIMFILKERGVEL